LQRGQKPPLVDRKGECVPSPSCPRMRHCFRRSSTPFVFEA
jgi:hypothetical protein